MVESQGAGTLEAKSGRKGGRICFLGGRGSGKGAAQDGEAELYAGAQRVRAGVKFRYGSPQFDLLVSTARAAMRDGRLDFLATIVAAVNGKGLGQHVIDAIGARNLSAVETLLVNGRAKSLVRNVQPPVLLHDTARSQLHPYCIMQQEPSHSISS